MKELKGILQDFEDTNNVKKRDLMDSNPHVNVSHIFQSNSTTWPKNAVSIKN